MSSILDLLINEVASVLQITPEEVKSRFTKEQLDELLNSSLCEPDDSSGIPVTSLTDVPCDDLAIPNLLPPLSLDDINKIKEPDQQDPNQCVSKVDEITQAIGVQIDEYSKYNTLLEKLVEYRDSFYPIAAYYDERSKEVARILSIFDPILTSIETLHSKQSSLRDEQNSLIAQKTEASLAGQTQTVSQLNVKINEITNQLNTISDSIEDNENILKKEKRKIEYFDNNTIGALSTLVSSLSDSNQAIQTLLVNILTNLFEDTAFANIESQFQSYSQTITISSLSDDKPLSIQDALLRSRFNFKIKFPKLLTLQTEKEVVDKQTGAKHIEKTTFPIKGNPLLEKDSFFKDYSNFELTEFSLNNDVLPIGTIYTGYYNKFKDPINNFFTPDERGLTSDINLVDPVLKGSGAEIKKEKDRDFYVKDLATMQDFYQTFDTRFDNRKNEVRNTVIIPAQEKIRNSVKLIAQKEVQLFLAIGKANKHLPSESSTLSTIIDLIETKNKYYVQGLADLDSEISRIKSKIAELKPTPEKIKKMLKEKSPACFEKIDQEVGGCADVKQRLGEDPLFTKTIHGIDPTLPNSNQLCYWVEFAKIATTSGLLPIPNIPNFTQLRYWPVGLTIPYPGGLIKIPLPIVWVPLVTISTPAGSIVLFLTINGVFISPVVFFVSSSGYKQHIVTVKGQSEKFGYTADDESIKPGLHVPLSAIAIKSTAERLAKEAQLGKNYAMSAIQKAQTLKQQTILTETMKMAVDMNNVNRILKVTREQKNLDEASSGLSDAEKFQKIADRLDSAKDLISDAKRSVMKRIDELGKPALGSINSLKSKVLARKETLLADLKKSLVDGDEEKADKLRKLLNSDGVSLDDKIAAIQKDMMTYFERIKFPKVIIPKDFSTIDTKKNALIELLAKVNEFSEIYGTQFYSLDDQTVRHLLMVQVAKNKNKIKAEIDPLFGPTGKIDLSIDLEKAKTSLTKAVTSVVDSLTGNGPSGDVAKANEDATILKAQVDSETDPVKKVKLKKKLEAQQSKISEFLATDRTKFALNLTPEIVALLGQLSVDFNPFASCCKKSTFSLPTGISPAIPILFGIKEILNLAISQLSLEQLKSLFGGRIVITSNELISAFLGIIINKVPADLVIPLPSLNLITLAKSFAGLLTSLVEPKAPILAAQPALPNAIVIDLNLIKKPLANLLITYLLNCLPDHPSPNPDALPGSTNSTQLGHPSKNNKGLNRATIDKNIQMVSCDDDTSQDSVLSDGNYSPSDYSTQKNKIKLGQSNSPMYSSGTVFVKSKKDLHLNFQTLDIDVLSINPGDFIAILKNFIELKFDAIENLIEPFYSVLNLAKGLKGTNLNAIESAQFKTPPYGPAAEVTFNAIATIKKLAPKSALLKLADLSAISQKVAILEKTLGPIVNYGVPSILVASAGAADSILPKVKVPEVNIEDKSFTTKELKVSTNALRQIHPLLSQDDIPPWERLSNKNLLFLLFLDEFIATGADQVGFFRAYV